MPELNQFSLQSPRIKKIIFFGLAAVLLCVLGAGIYVALGKQRSSELLESARTGGGHAPEGYVPVLVTGTAQPSSQREPGEKLRRLLQKRELPLHGAQAVIVAADSGDEHSLAAVDEAVIKEAAREVAARESRISERRERLAKLQKRLDKVRARHEEPVPEGDPLVEVDGAPVQEAHSTLAEGSVQKGLIAKGETVSQILDAYLSPAEVEALAATCRKVYPLKNVRAGHAYAVTVWEGEFKRFEYEIDRERKLVVRKTEEGFQVGEKELEFDTYTVRLAGEISLSLFGAVERMGENGALAMRLADIFGWEIDFIRDIRVGDSFRVVVEKRLRNGKFMGYGDILAAEFVNQGAAYRGYQFHDESGRPGYYDAEGESLRKAFLKAPLDFTRISSDFTWRRLHPILKKYRPHPGIDYAAPIGTPVRSVANGVILSKGWMGGGGNSVRIRHMNGYETLYMHLSRFARIKKGQKVDQGEIIAYVGSTGLSTGPHLDFRMKKNGKYINPHKVENPKEATLSKHMLAAFDERVHKLNALLEDEDFAPVRDFALEAYLPDMAAR